MKNLLHLFLFLSCSILSAQTPEELQNATLPHQLQSDYYQQFSLATEATADSLRCIENNWAKIPKGKKHQTKQNCTLNKQVYGWHPYWVGTAYNNYDFTLLSTFSYFSYELNPSTGNYSSIHSWKTTPSIDLAKADGCRVELCVTNFGSSNNTTFLSNSSAWTVLADSLISLVNYRQAHGVNIDFEGVPGSQTANFTAFLQYLCNRMHTEIPGSTVTMAIYSVDWNGVFDMPNLVNYIDAFIIMGYGYHYSGSTQAGPNDPLYHGSIWSTYTLNRSVDYYLNTGCPPEKLIVGLPYYGQEWNTTASSIPASTTSFVGSRTYAYIQSNYIGTYTPIWDDHSKTQAIIYNSGNWRQCWYDDELTLGERCDMIRDKKLGGMGIWALGYDDGYNELWTMIEDHFTDCANICSDINYDTGGNLGQYLNNQNSIYTFTENSLSQVRINFTEFDVEANYDYVYIHDGFDTNAPLIGTYTGTTLPPPITSTSNALTLHFTSDGATLGDGWTLQWSVLPKTDLEPFDVCFADDFVANFNDESFCADIAYSFYLPEMYQENEWRANNNNSFFYDNFDDNILHSDWTSSAGTWSESGAFLAQTDAANGNSNIYANVNEATGFAYLYTWDMMIGGTGTNRRAGIHFFSDNPSLPNRGNSYFIYFRADSDLLQFYKVVNDTWTLVQDVPVNVDVNTWYHCKLLFDQSTGTISVWRDDVFVSSWTDPTPHTSGGGISPRTGGCLAYYDNMKVYKSRGLSQLITVGNATTEDLYIENSTPTQAAGQLETIVLDTDNIFSNTFTLPLNIDFSPPSAVSVNDGTAVDEDVTTNTTTLSANWSDSVDANSEIMEYWYQIGTSPLGNDVVAATDNGLLTSFSLTGLTLTPGTTYYVSVWAENCATLLSPMVSSDGILVQGDCPATNVISTNYTAGENLSFAVSNYIIANNTVGAGTQISYTAGNYIILENGFNAAQGSDFTAQIGGCATALENNGNTEEIITDAAKKMNKNPKNILSENILSENVQVQIFPNPNNGSFSIRASAEIQQLVLLNAQGKMVYQKNVANEAQVYLENTSLTSGLYILYVQTSKGTITQKVMVQ
ncbi:MAG: glycosyl hydrolase family 18 protein [Chitinophagales bacterium]|nr:T9SS type A sorting domain-containing protein [Bacteroidota bacterium]MCB9042552.1 T9SS type A sorting domain-containing protein [Chitinophagales bacterium]